MGSSMNYNKFNRAGLSATFSFYAKALTYPFEEMRHELQHQFRQVEKNIVNEYDNTVASRILDVLNTYQGEEMKDLQGEYTRLFTPHKKKEPLISLRLSDWLKDRPTDELEEQLFEAGISVYSDEYPDFISHILEYFASILQYEDEQTIRNFFDRYLKEPVPALCQEIYKNTNVNFYRECVKGLHDLIHLMQDALDAEDED